METTITLSPLDSRIAIFVGGELLTTVKDGAGLIGRVDRELRANGISRGGFTSVGGFLTAVGAALR